MQKLMMICAAVLFLTTAASAQKFFTRDGKVKFNSDASMEKIEAISNKATCVLDAATGKMGWKVLIKGFLFEKALMQEHFNENYMESSKYPNATFDGEITNLKDINFSKDGTYDAKVKGKMTIHGVTKDFTNNGKITVGGGKVRINTGFDAALADYDIKVPSVVKDNIAKEIKVLVDATLEPMK